TEILKRINRRYTREEYLELVRKIRTAIPHAVLTTDIIVGFPGETEEQFEDTLYLVPEVGYDAAFIVIYSPRPGAPAAEMEDSVPDEVKKERLARLNELVAELALAANRNMIGQTVEVLVEGSSKREPDVLTGRTRGNKLVHFRGPAELAGTFAQVKITDTQTWYLTGEWVPAERTAETAAVGPAAPEGVKPAHA